MEIEISIGEIIDKLTILSIKKQKIIETVKLKNIEKELGRLPTSSLQYESRIIDIDILLYDSEVFSAKNLHIPHLSFHQRRFALLPVVEISPLFFHPYYNCTMETLLRNCDYNSAVLALE